MAKSLIHTARPTDESLFKYWSTQYLFCPPINHSAGQLFRQWSFIVTNYININYWLAPLTITYCYCPSLSIGESTVLYGSISISILPLFSNGHFCMFTDPSESSKLLLIIDLCHQLYNEVRVGFEPVKNSNVVLPSIVKNHSSLVPLITVI